jgi:CRISPR-associated protein Cas1
VKSGDATTRDSIAARIYFKKLLDDTARQKPIWHNAALNYGYAICRGLLARSIATRGLILSQGIFHHNELNAFNLADDLIEPFRAAVDEFVLSKVFAKHIGQKNDATLTCEDRHQLIDITNQYVIIYDKKFTIKHAADLVVESFVKTIQSGNVAKFALPEIL